MTSDGDVKLWMERLYGFATMQQPEIIDRILDMMDECQGRILLYRRRLYGWR